MATSGTIFTEIFFGMSKEWVRSWLHAFLIAYLKTLAKRLSAVYLEMKTRKKKRKKKDNCNVLNADAIKEKGKFRSKVKGKHSTTQMSRA